MKFETHPDVKRYEDSVELAVQSRTNRSVEDITTEGAHLTLTLDQEPTVSEKNEVDDILAATERYPETVDGPTLTYQLQEIDPDDPDLPDRHKTLDQRISENVGDEGMLGRNVGGVPPKDVQTDATGKSVDVQLPESASETAKQRLQNAMLAFGKTLNS